MLIGPSGESPPSQNDEILSIDQILDALPQLKEKLTNDQLPYRCVGHVIMQAGPLRYYLIFKKDGKAITKILTWDTSDVETEARQFEQAHAIIHNFKIELDISSDLQSGL